VLSPTEQVEPAESARIMEARAPEVDGTCAQRGLHRREVNDLP